MTMHCAAEYLRVAHLAAVAATYVDIARAQGDRWMFQQHA
jgi:hypothetical protein